MKCLSVRQSWADCLVPEEWMYDASQWYFRLRGFALPKDVENRTWGTSYRGPLLIHAAKKWEPQSPMISPAHEPVGGAIIGVVELYDVSTEKSSPWHEKGKVGWYVKRPRRFKQHIRYRGEQGLFEVPYEIVKHEFTKEKV